MTVVVRQATKNDLTEIQNIARTSWHHTYEGIIPRHIQDRFLDSAYNNAKMQLRLERSVLYVAELNNKVVGFANYSYVKANGQSELVAIYLQPSAQRLGIGTALLNEAITSLQGLKEIYINVERDNNIGTSFYQSKGFTFVEAFDDDFDGHVLNTIRMVYRLT